MRHIPWEPHMVQNANFGFRKPSLVFVSFLVPTLSRLNYFYYIKKMHSIFRQAGMKGERRRWGDAKIDAIKTNLQMKSLVILAKRICWKRHYKIWCENWIHYINKVSQLPLPIFHFSTKKSLKRFNNWITSVITDSAHIFIHNHSHVTIFSPILIPAVSYNPVIFIVIKTNNSYSVVHTQRQAFSIIKNSTTETNIYAWVLRKWGTSIDFADYTGLQSLGRKCSQFRFWLIPPILTDRKKMRKEKIRLKKVSYHWYREVLNASGRNFELEGQSLDSSHSARTLLGSGVKCSPIFLASLTKADSSLDNIKKQLFPSLV